LPEKYQEFLALNKELAQKWPNITHRKDPPADADEWKDKEDKLQYLEK
jgi:ferredoxin